MKSDHLPLWGWILVGLTLLIQATWIFLDARSRGKKPWLAWLWGFWGLTSFPLPSIVYLIAVIGLDRRRRKTGRSIRTKK